MESFLRPIQWKMNFQKGSPTPTPYSLGSSVKFLPVVWISPFSHFFCVFITKTVEIRWNWRCKSFSLKFRRCKILDKSHVWYAHTEISVETLEHSDKWQTSDSNQICILPFVWRPCFYNGLAWILNFIYDDSIVRIIRCNRCIAIISKDDL